MHGNGFGRQREAGPLPIFIPTEDIYDHIHPQRMFSSLPTLGVVTLYFKGLGILDVSQNRWKGTEHFWFGFQRGYEIERPDVQPCQRL